MKSSRKPLYIHARNVIIFLISAYIVLSFLRLFEPSARAMLNLPEEHLDIDNANPVLLELALTPKDFSDEYRWYYQSLTGYERGATSELGGHYRGYRFDIFQSVSKYNQDLFWTKDGDFQYLSGPVALSGVHNLQEIGVADFQKTECLFDLDDRITCRMGIGDSDIGMELEINYHNQDDKNAMKRILNLVIDTIGEKLKSP